MLINIKSFKLSLSLILYIGAVWIQLIPSPRFTVAHFAFFFFLVQPTIVDHSTVNSAPVHCSRVPQITFFNNFFIKNRSHIIIHIFKKYFATVFSVFSF